MPGDAADSHPRRTSRGSRSPKASSPSCTRSAPQDSAEGRSRGRDAGAQLAEQDGVRAEGVGAALGPEQGQHLGRAHEPGKSAPITPARTESTGSYRPQAGEVLQPEQILVVSQRDHRAQPRPPRPGRPGRIDKVPRQVMCQGPAASCRREHGDPPEFLRPGQAAVKVTRQLRFQACMRQRSQVLDGQRVRTPDAALARICRQRRPGKRATGTPRRSSPARARWTREARPQARDPVPRSMQRSRPAIRG